MIHCSIILHTLSASQRTGVPKFLTITFYLLTSSHSGAHQESFLSEQKILVSPRKFKGLGVLSQLSQLEPKYQTKRFSTPVVQDVSSLRISIPRVKDGHQNKNFYRKFQYPRQILINYSKYSSKRIPNAFKVLFSSSLQNKKNKSFENDRLAKHSGTCL